jgi:hypothetical protein
MKYILTLIAFYILMIVSSCKKETEEKVRPECFPLATTTRQIVNMKAVVKLSGGLYYGAYIIEEGSIDAKLIPCDLPMEFYKNDLQVIISGDVKQTSQDNFGPCCTNFFVITKITK